MTAALDALARIDDGLPVSPADRVLLDLFDAHSSSVWHRRLTALDVPPAGFCLLHGERLDEVGDCGTCFIDYDAAMRRVEDQ